MTTNVWCPKSKGGCGWKGERIGDLRAAELSEDDYRQACTAQPCPRCRGKVELVPTSP